MNKRMFLLKQSRREKGFPQKGKINYIKGSESLNSFAEDNSPFQKTAFC